MEKQSPLFVFGEEIPWTPVGEGVNRKILGYGPDLMMVSVTFKKGSIGYVHKHPHRQVSYVTSGSFEVNIGGEKKIQKTGDCYYLPADVEHGVVALEDSSLIDVFTPVREDFLK
ncbi:MAG: cupin domain-containing protein [Ignavibacteriales bacterium]|nr:cupin domain-containing protein [Ignavibacteriales bacterium]